MIGPAIGWIEIRAVPSARVDLVANQLGLGWLTRYPLPNKVIVNRENEFREMVINDYSITVNPITSRNTKPMQY